MTIIKIHVKKDLFHKNANSFTLTQSLACGIVAVKKFDHNNVPKYDIDMVSV